MRAPPSRRAAGFTLLEVMVAVSILAVSLTFLVEATIRAVAAENHSKLVTTATFLARRVMVDLEDELQEKGLQDDSFSSEKTGTFEEGGFRRFTWARVVDKIVLPSQADVQSALGAATQPGASGGGLSGFASGGAPSPLAAVGGAGGSTPGGAASTNMFASNFGIVKEILEQGIRRVTIRVLWRERGIDQQIEVNEYLTDPRRVDQAISIPTGIPGQQNPSPNSNPSPNPNPTPPTSPRN
jgi:general secretion pathway protein I